MIIILYIVENYSVVSKGNNLLLLCRYQSSINRLHDLVMDQPMHPVDRAAWWMEYLIRHPNSEDSMRNPVLDLSWWQYFLIDVIIFFAIVVLILTIIIKFAIKLCCCRGGTNRKSKKE